MISYNNYMHKYYYKTKLSHAAQCKLYGDKVVVYSKHHNKKQLISY